MSDVKSFRYSDDGNWKLFKRALEDEGQTIEGFFSSQVNQRVTLYANEEGEEEPQITRTASKCRDDLCDELFETQKMALSQAIALHKYHVILATPQHMELIERSDNDLQRNITTAVHNAVYRYWTDQIIRKNIGNDLQVYMAKHPGCRDDLTMEQAYLQEKTRIDMTSEKFHDAISSTVKVTFDCSPILPRIKISDLTEKHLNQIMEFNAVIIGPSARKLEKDTGKYIQKVLIQEMQADAKNNNPATIKCMLHGNDTYNIASGQHKRIIGRYRSHDDHRSKKQASTTAASGDPSTQTLYIDALSISDIVEAPDVVLSNHDISVAREFAHHDEKQYVDYIIDSFCPKIYGRNFEKFALILALLGGTRRPGFRHEIHTMLVGDADTGKSELIKFANEVSWKSSIIDGSSSTGVGITFALDEYDGTKILRSGAMILNSGGHIIIDEGDKMSPAEHKKLNQAMEQRKATYNKGGHIGNAVTETTVIEACNPHNEKWNSDNSFIDNMPFGRSTLSRFDIILRSKHESNEVAERAKLKHILHQRRGTNQTKVASREYLRGLFTYLSRASPQIPPEIDEEIINQYIDIKYADDKEDGLSLETRQMEAIQRLCESYAKLTFRDKVDSHTVSVVFGFLKDCLETLGMITSKGGIQQDLRGHSINKDEYFEEVFRELSLENDSGSVFAHDLAAKLLDNAKFFKTDKAVASYIESRKRQGWLYEPRVGTYRRQSK